MCVCLFVCVFVCCVMVPPVLFILFINNSLEITPCNHFSIFYNVYKETNVITQLTLEYQNMSLSTEYNDDNAFLTAVDSTP
jgi:hypothetical protein